MKQKVILDCDNTLGIPRKEIDDGLAYLYLCGCRDVELLAVTTTFGNGTLEEVLASTRKLVQLLNQETHVLAGEAHRIQETSEAAHFLAHTARDYPRQVTLVATGPLGNIAAAAKLDRQFFSNLKEIICMGGMLNSMRLGFRELGELNLSANPEAAWQVLNNRQCPVTLMNAELCLQASFGYLDMLRAYFLPKFIRQATFNWLFLFGTYFGIFKFFLWDLLPSVYLSYPELFEKRFIRLESNLSDLEAGRLVVVEDENGVINMPSRITDMKRFKRILFDGWRSFLP